VRERGGETLRAEHDKLWWIVATEIDDPSTSALVRLREVREYQDFAKLRRVLWKWYRSVCARRDLTIGAKYFLFFLVERYRWETMSSHDAINYYYQMAGINRKTAGRCVQELAEKEIIWIVLESERKRLRKSQARGRKHYLLVGLGHLLGGKD